MITLNTPSMKSCGIHFMCCTINAISAINFSWSKCVLHSVWKCRQKVSWKRLAKTETVEIFFQTIVHCCANLKFFELHRFDMYRGLFLCKIQPRKMSKLWYFSVECKYFLLLNVNSRLFDVYMWNCYFCGFYCLLVSCAYSRNVCNIPRKWRTQKSALSLLSFEKF